MSKKKHKQVFPFPGTEHLTRQQQLKFIDLHLDFLNQGRFIFSFHDTTDTFDQWLIYLDKQLYKSPISALRKIAYQNKNKSNPNHPALEDLDIIFNPNNTIENKIWEDLGNQLAGLKIAVSHREIIRLNDYQQRNYIHFLNAAISNFPFIKLFQQLKKEQIQIPTTVERGAHNLFSIFLNWVQATKSLVPFLPYNVLIPENVFWLPTITEFRNQLPSTQLTILLFKLASSLIIEVNSSSQIDKYINHSLPEVNQFFRKNGTTIVENLNDILASDDDIFGDLETKNKLAFRKDFIDIIKLDIDYLLYQETIENEFGFGIKESLNSSTINSFLVNDDTVTSWLQEITKYSIIDRLDDLRLKQNSKHLPNLPTYFHSKLRASTVDRLHKSKKSLSIFPKVLKDIPADKINPTIEAVEDKWMNHLSHLCNQWMIPFLKFKNKEGMLIPHWNLLDSKIGERLLSEYADWENDRVSNQKQLKAFVKKLPNYKKKISINELHKSLRGSLPVQNSVDAHNRRYSTIEKYRNEKMMEFGILDEKRLADKSEQIWLDEMLSLEKGTSNYLQFVKKAFQAALPIRKSTVFNYDRHASNGVEFDPQTAQDTHKWMHGEIMVTLKTEIKKGNAIQINAFALDASGSMEHEKMRNLFKILTLLVTGLEDRKSFDSFHFFSNTFIEAVNFSDQYTNRNLLFNILQTISQIEEGTVVYDGNGGTNMSAGIKGCVDRINKFHSELKQKNPEAIFLKSLFVITDGQPSVGIIDPKILNLEIQRIRTEEDIVIKGIFLKPEEEIEKEENFMAEIFGKGNFVETNEFGKAVNEFVYIMTQTYKRQRKDLRYKNKNIK